MKNTIISEPIQYYILDESINADKYQENAVRLEIKLEDIQNIFHDTPLKDYGLIGMFENVSTIPNYAKQMEYFKGIWVGNSFHDMVYKELKQYNGEKTTDIMCFVLMVLKKIESKHEFYSKPDLKTPDMEVTRFLHDLLRREGDSPKNIELTRGAVLKKYDFGEHILHKLKRMSDGYYLKCDLKGFAELMFASKSSFHYGYTPAEKKKLKWIFRMYCLKKIGLVTALIPATYTEKYIIINQSFALANIIDYKRMRSNTPANIKKYAGRVRSQIEQYKMYMKKCNSKELL